MMRQVSLPDVASAPGFSNFFLKHHPHPIDTVSLNFRFYRGVIPLWEVTEAAEDDVCIMNIEPRWS